MDFIARDFPGTVSASIADIDFVKKRENIEQLFEDGTVSFLDIASIRHGFRIINRLTMLSIARYFFFPLYKHFKSRYLRKLALTVTNCASNFALIRTLLIVVFL